MTIFNFGSPVLLHGDIPATVLAVAIRSQSDFDYKVVWWDGRNRKEEWVNSREVEASKDSFDKRQIGFGT